MALPLCTWCSPLPAAQADNKVSFTLSALAQTGPAPSTPRRDEISSCQHRAVARTSMMWKEITGDGKEQTTMSRCFSDTPCQLSELPDIWHCLDLLRSGTAAAANLETAHASPHLSHSVSSRLQGSKDWHPSCEKTAPWTKKLHTPFQVVSAILRLTTPQKTTYWEYLYPQQNAMLVPRRETLSLYKESQIFPRCTEVAGRKSVSLHEEGCGMSTVPVNFLIWITVQWI